MIAGAGASGLCAAIMFRFSDRDLVRVWADENAATFNFLLDNGVKFDEVMSTLVNDGTVPRLFRTVVYSDDLKETINGSPGSGLLRALEKSARANSGDSFRDLAESGQKWRARHPSTGLGVP